jgi:hypothetical protein
MTAEDYNNTPDENLPEISSDPGKTIDFILQSIKAASSPFNIALKQPNLWLPLNENKLTQIFVEQIEVKIKSHQNIGVKNQYSDLFFGTRGIPDFYFHRVEEGVIHEPLFVVESKRLPSPNYEKEYVKGENENGGIERFKIEKHGKGLSECGLLGFIENGNYNTWILKINSWIKDISISDTTWNIDEEVKEIENKAAFVYLNSIAHTTSKKDMLLHHFWIK